MKKNIAYILLILHVFFTGNFGSFFHPKIEQASAGSATWDFSTFGDYTLSDTSLNVKDGIGDLNFILEQTGSLANNGSTVFLDRALRVHVVGDYAYVSAQTQDRIQVIDISDPANPTAETNLQNNGTTLMLDGPRDFASTGSYLFISENTGDAIQTIDISDPTNPTAAGNYANNGSVRLNGPRGLDIQGDYLYVASFNDDALQVFDISTPTSLVDAGELDTANGRLNGARDIIVEGNYAYISARNDDSIQVVDISTPSSPSFAGEITNGGAVTLDSVYGIDKQGDYIYAAAYNQDAIQVIDVSTPTSPSAVTSVGTAVMPNLDGPRDVVADGDFLFVADYIGDSITILDISDPSNPTFEYELQESGSTNINGPRDLYRVGDLLHASMFVDDDFVTFETKYDDSSPTIIPNTAFDFTGENLISFTETLGAGNEGSVTYQISKDDGTTWYYWNGSSWQTTTNGVVDSNSASVINTNIADFDLLAGGTDQFLWKAFLTSDGTEKVEIDNIDVTSQAPGPGGVGSNLQVWLKADAGTSTTTDGNSLSTWNDQSGNGYNASAVTAPTYYSTTHHLNFNPLVDFNGTTQYMQNLANGAYTDSYFMVIVPDDTVDGTLTGQVPFGFDCLSGTLSSGTCGLSFAGTVLGSFTVAIPDEVITHAIGSSANWRSAETGVSSYSSGKPMLIIMNENSGASGTDIYEKGVKVDNHTTNTYQTLSTADYSIGRSLDGTYPFYYDGKIAEVINYSSRVSDSERNNIESYLSIKYGITLNNGTQNYTASDGSTTYWSTVTGSGYTNNIFGIGRDDTSELGQVKSQSVNDDGVIVLEAIGEGTNASPSFTDIGDLEFLTISHDAGGNAWSAIDAPATYNILTRKWKSQEIGEVGTLNIDFDVADSDFDIPVLNAGTNYYFIHDSDGDGNLNDETPTSMTNTTGNIWRASGVDLENDRIFTIATEASSNNIPTDITLSNDTIDENVANGSTVGTLSTTDADVSDTHTYSFVSGTGDDDNGNFSLSGSTLTIDNSPDYELKNTYSVRIETDDGNGGTYQEAFNIYISNLGEAITTIIDLEDISDESKYTVTSGVWNRNTVNPQEGSYSLESDNGGANNTQSCFEVQHTFSATGTVDFEYSVSSETASDYLRFYIDDVEQGSGWSGTVPYTSYTSSDIAPGLHDYKWCYIKDGGGSAGTDNAYIDYIHFPNTAGDITPPTISSINFASGSLLPGGNHDIVINYSDSESGIDTSSDSIALYKWNGATWGSDISATGLDLGSKVITSTSATYPTNNLDFGKYRYDFDISDNDANTSMTGAVFYIDEPEMLISTGSIDIGNINHFTQNFSDTVTVTVYTVGAAFDVKMNRSSTFTEGGEDIPSWNGTNGYGYDPSPFTGSISEIAVDEIIASESANINTDGNRNTYTYDFKIGALVEEFRSAGDYLGNLDFTIELNY